MKKTGRRKKRGRILLGVAAFLLLLVGAVAVYWHLYRPTPRRETPFSGEETYTPSATAFNFLLIGRDRAASLADVVMVVHLDAAAGRLAVMQLPRDTYVETDASTPKLNAAYAAFYKASAADGAASPTLPAANRLAEALEKRLCISLDYSLVMDLDGFGQIVDLLAPEGIPIDVPMDMEYTDPAQELTIHLQAGRNILHGAEAEQFVRFRSGYALADVGRVDAQKLFLTALLTEVRESLGSMGIAALTELTGQVLKSTDTDLTLLDAVYFARSLLRVDLSAASLMTAPGEALQNEAGTWYYQINRDDTLVLLNEYFNIYDLEIPGKAFDAAYALTDVKDGIQLALYFDESGRFAKVYTASDIEEHSIEIKPKSSR